MIEPKFSRDGLSNAERKGLVWIVVGIVIVIFAALAAFVIASTTLSTARYSQIPVEHTRDIIEEVQTILALLQDAETGERGYVITGAEEFLEPFVQAEKKLEPQIAKLQSMLIDGEAKRLSAELARHARNQMGYLKQVVKERRDGNLESAALLVRQGLGKQQMDSIRSTIAALGAREQLLLAQRQAVFTGDSARSEKIIVWSLLIATLCVLLAATLLAVYVRRKLHSDRMADRNSALLRSTVENITQGVIVFDNDSRIIAWNSQYLNLRGLAASTLKVGMDIGVVQKFATPMTLTVAGTAHDSRVSAPGFGDLSQPFDGEGVCEDGRVLVISGRPAVSGHYVVTASDITPLKKSEAAHRDQATRLTSILDNVVDAIITINESGNIESWSKGAEKLFGYSEEDVLRRNVSMIIPEPRAAAHNGYLRQYAATGEKHIIGRRRDVEAVHKDGSFIDVELGVSEMYIDSRRLFVGVLRDISQRLEVERLKSGFVSTVSHELRTPLTSISASLGLLVGTMQDQLPAKAARLIQIAVQNSDRLVRLINDILDLEKAESGKIEFVLQKQSLLPILQTLVDANRGFAHTHNAKIELAADSNDAIVLVDRDRLAQVLTNLVSNAIKFSPPHGVVRVHSILSGDSVRVFVQDEGPGITPEFQQRIFQRFAQADSSDSRAKGGTGLGLSIAKTMIERLGGSIGFDAHSRQGALFFVTLPVLKH